jgi:hypothetical protein
MDDLRQSRAVPPVARELGVDDDTEEKTGLTPHDALAALHRKVGRHAFVGFQHFLTDAAA